jgi:3',5'-cyclic AMP phosphodiesterase CpdA
MKFIHISDLHFHGRKKDNKVVSKSLKFIAKEYPEHYLIVTGDITDDGLPEQYDRAFESLSAFIGRIFICPGNHDFGAAGLMYERERAMLFDTKLSKPLGQNGIFAGSTQPVTNIVRTAGAQVLLIAVNSTPEAENFFDFEVGEIGKKQLSALGDILADPRNAAMTKFLFLHHHPVPFMGFGPFSELKDARELVRLVYQRIDVLLFGHRHVSKMWVDMIGVRFVLRADNAPGKDYAREISVTKRDIAVTDISIAC